MSQPPQVALRIGMTNDYLRDIITGVVDYARGADWVWAEQPWQRRLTGTPFAESCQGAIISWQNYEDIAQAMERGIAVVCVTGSKPSEPVPRVIPDNDQIGRRGARYLLDKGLRTLAYVGEGIVHWSAVRQTGFVRMAAEAGAACHVRPRAICDGMPPLGRWLSALPGPVGLMAGNDVVATACIDACRREGLRVPEDVAILGVDNNPLICEFSDPTLSSIDPRPRRIGYEAAAVLDRLLHGESVDRSDQLVEPGQVVERGSTDTLAVADRLLSDAIRQVRTGASAGKSLKEILAGIPMSRSSLERGFKDVLGRTPGAELRRVRLENARMLLRETDLSIKHIASQSGFSTQRHLSDAFQAAYAQRPSQYRAAVRAAPVVDDKP